MLSLFFQLSPLDELSERKMLKLFSRASKCVKFMSILLVLQKQSPSGVPRKTCSENIQQIYRRTPMPKCDFNKLAKQLY